MLIARLESADWHDIHIAVQQGPEIKFKMNLIEDRSTRAELHKEVDVGIPVIFTSRYRAEHLDVQGVPSSEETLDLLSMRNHNIANLTHKQILTDGA
jgi:hypothetical protein